MSSVAEERERGGGNLAGTLRRYANFRTVCCRIRLIVNLRLNSGMAYARIPSHPGSPEAAKR